MITWIRNKLNEKKLLRESLEVSQAARMQWAAESANQRSQLEEQAARLKKTAAERDELDRKRQLMAKDSADRQALLEAVLAAEKAKRNVTWPRPAGRMNPIEVKRAFAVEPTDNLWRVVHQELDDAIQDALDEATIEPSATMTAEQRTYRSGKAEALREFQKTLFDAQHAARTKDVELEEEAKP